MEKRRILSQTLITVYIDPQYADQNPKIARKTQDALYQEALKWIKRLANSGMRKVTDHHESD